MLIQQHRTTAQRCAAAAAFAADFGISMQVLVDPVPGEEEEEGQQEEEAPAESSDGAGADVATAVMLAVAGGGEVRGAEAGGSCDMPAAQVSGASAPAQQPHQKGVGPGKAIARDAYVLRACTGQQQQHAASSATPPPTVQLSCASGSCGSMRLVGYGNSGPFHAALAPWPRRFYVLDRAGLLLFKADQRTAATTCSSCGTGWSSRGRRCRHSSTLNCMLDVRHGLVCSFDRGWCEQDRGLCERECRMAFQGDLNAVHGCVCEQFEAQGMWRRCCCCYDARALTPGHSDAGGPWLTPPQ